MQHGSLLILARIIDMLDLFVGICCGVPIDERDIGRRFLRCFMHVAQTFHNDRSDCPKSDQQVFVYRCLACIVEVSRARQNLSVNDDSFEKATTRDIMRTRSSSLPIDTFV